MNIGGARLTRRGERLVGLLGVLAFLLLMGFVGWLETAGL